MPSVGHEPVADGENEQPRPGSVDAASRKSRKEHGPPQKLVDTFWKSFNSKFPGRVLQALPQGPDKAPPQPVSNVAHSQIALDSYDRAKIECETAVNRIVKQCLRINQKYTDPHFDIETDLKFGRRNCLDGLQGVNDWVRPKGVKRVTEIFEKPEFYVNNATASDVRQGSEGDCWLMAALSTLGNMPGLIDKVCVARNEQVGVYGFVFYRDGEWRHTIIDDKLYLRAPDYEDAAWEREVWDDIGRPDTELNYRKTWQTGSRALYFAQCSDDNETWLPLLEKAYAKAHGDYSSIEGGFVGEAIEDLTGGVTSEIRSRDILDKERFWKGDLINVNKKFVFGCATGLYGRWLYPDHYSSKERSGIHECHAYSIMDAKEINGQRLLRVRNPWGHKEWSGPWSDGSEQWTREWMDLLEHKFGNDGVFWISYEDFLLKYEHIDRTRLFGEGWMVVQKWTSLHVPWALEYHQKRFVIKVTQEGPAVIVLSQLDKRYFKGLEGQYRFHLQFRLEKDGEEDYVIHNQNNVCMSRSVSVDITLEPGTYTVLVRVKATQCKAPPPEDVIRETATKKREKLVQIGHSHDLAHAKGVELESEEEEAERKRRETETKAALKRKERDRAEARLRKLWIRSKKYAARDKRRIERGALVRAKRAKEWTGDVNKWEEEVRQNLGLAEEDPWNRANGSYRDEDSQKREVSTMRNREKEDDGLESSMEDTKVAGKVQVEDMGHKDDDTEPLEAQAKRKEVKEHKDSKTECGDMNQPVNDDDGKEVKQDEILEDKREENVECAPGSENRKAKEKREIDMSTAPKLAKEMKDECQKDVHPGKQDEQSDHPIEALKKFEMDSDDSGSDFEFDSEIDMPPTKEPDSDGEEQDTDGDGEEEEKDDGEYSAMPRWNAVCVVGLRVYSKDSDLTISTVKPKSRQEDFEARRDSDAPAVE
ncbi:hypothetical protein EMPG_13182 [Blastomyces silverae]|uniref:Calpain catalytic domain-containing protein n=1 Tax=Blastomyces silverae TaxID=2060906 RepID=A0A0H1BKT9_9EURO|nr:hypothetical protein EMPG_13182 [Blastomyces silverae]